MNKLIWAGALAAGLSVPGIIETADAGDRDCEPGYSIGIYSSPVYSSGSRYSVYPWYDDDGSWPLRYYDGWPYGYSSPWPYDYHYSRPYSRTYYRPYRPGFSINPRYRSFGGRYQRHYQHDRNHRGYRDRGRDGRHHRSRD